MSLVMMMIRANASPYVDPTELPLRNIGTVSQVTAPYVFGGRCSGSNLASTNASIAFDGAGSVIAGYQQFNVMYSSDLGSTWARSGSWSNVTGSSYGRNVVYGFSAFYAGCGNGSNIRMGLSGGRYTPAVSNITSLVLQGFTSGTTNTLANCFTAGTVARLYRKKRGTPSSIPSVSGMLVADILLNSPTTSLSITGLDGNLHGGYFGIFNFTPNSTAGSNFVGLFFNGDTTAGNYSVVRKYANSALSPGIDLSNSIVDLGNASEIITAVADIIPYGTSVEMFTRSFAKYTTSFYNVDSVHHYKNASFSNITSLLIQSTVANAIGAGSRFRLYRRK